MDHTVVTHLAGALYSSGRAGGGDDTVARLKRKLTSHREMVSRDFRDFDNPTFMIWSPYVAAGVKVDGLKEMVAGWPTDHGSLKLVINSAYTSAMQSLLDLAARDDGHTEEPFYRMCQLLTHLRSSENRRVGVRIE